jgi:hypothetical protein
MSSNTITMQTHNAQEYVPYHEEPAGNHSSSIFRGKK